MASKTMTFKFVGDPKSLLKSMKDSRTGSQKMGDVFKKVGTGIAIGLAVAGAAAIKFAVDSIQSLAKIEILNKQTDSVIKATGSAANVTSKHVQDLAGKLEKVTATEAENIQEGANLILTFKNIRNETGKGNDIFDQTVAIATDMARALGTDVKSGAIQLGKALNDPIKGIAALSRVGVTFTADQEKMIRKLAESGDVMGAQKIILQELNSEFGGSGAAYASTYAGKLDSLKNAFGDIGEKIMTGAMPALGEFVDWMKGDGIAGIQGVVDWITKYKDILGPAALALGGLTAAQWLLNIALDANPIGIVILALGALIAAAVLVAANWDAIWNGFLVPISKVEWGILQFVHGMVRNVLGGVQSMVNGAINILNALLTPLNFVLRMAHLPQVHLGQVNFTSGIDAVLAGDGAILGMLGGSRPNQGSTQIIGRKARAFADGGIVRSRPGGVFANIGEGRHDEAVIPLSPSVLAGLGGGGMTVNVHLSGSYAGTKTELAKTILSAVRDGVKNGVIPKGAIANA